MNQTMPPVPDGVFPYLFIRDRRGVEAVDFYSRAFGAREVFRNPAPDGRLMHARLEINGGLLMLSDEFPEYAHDSTKPEAGPPRGALQHLQVGNCDAAYAKAIDAGATPVMPPADMFWGDRYAQLRDPFGHLWSIGSPLKG